MRPPFPLVALFLRRQWTDCVPSYPFPQFRRRRRMTFFPPPAFRFPSSFLPVPSLLQPRLRNALTIPTPTTYLSCSLSCRYIMQPLPPSTTSRERHMRTEQNYTTLLKHTATLSVEVDFQTPTRGRTPPRPSQLRLYTLRPYLRNPHRDSKTPPCDLQLCALCACRDRRRRPSGASRSLPLPSRPPPLRPPLSPTRRPSKPASCQHTTSPFSTSETPPSPTEWPSLRSRWRSQA